MTPMFENPRPLHGVQIVRPLKQDREQIERAREIINFAKTLLANSDPSVLFRWHKPEPPSDTGSRSQVRRRRFAHDQMSIEVCGQAAIHLC